MAGTGGPRPVEFTFGVQIVDGTLDTDGGINIPTTLIRRLEEETRREQDSQPVHVVPVIDGDPDSEERKDQQVLAFRAKLDEIWNRVDTDDWRLAESHDGSNGSQPPWEWGTGVVVKVKKQSDESFVLKADNEGTGGDEQKVHYALLVGLRFR